MKIRRFYHVRGKKRLLSQLQLEKLTRAIAEESPEVGIWTGTKVARWIEKEMGREKVWNQRGWDYLKKCPKGLASPHDRTGEVKEARATYTKSIGVFRGST